MDFVYQEGVLAGGVPTVVNVGGKSAPMTATLDSANGGRKIEFSADGGVNYYQPTYDGTTTPMITVTAKGPLSHIKFTGADADKWSIR